MQVYCRSVDFVRPCKSVFSSTQLLISDLHTAALTPPARALLDSVVLQRVKLLPAVAAERPLAADAMQLLGYVPYSQDSMAASEDLLGHQCNVDQQETVSKLQAGVHLVHGPPGTGTLVSFLSSSLALLFTTSSLTSSQDQVDHAHGGAPSMARRT